MPRAQSADGVIHDFPDGTDQAVIDRVMKGYAQQTPGAAPSAPAEPEGMFTRLWNGLNERAAQSLKSRRDNFDKTPFGGENALAASARMHEAVKGKPFREQALAPGWMENPMLWAMGTGNIGGHPPTPTPTPKSWPNTPATPPPTVQGPPMAPRNPEATARLRDFTEQGVTPSVPTISQGRGAGMMAQTGRVLPFSPVTRGIQQNLAETATAAERQASQFGGAAEPRMAGNISRNALRRFAQDTSQAERDYGAFDRLMHGAKPQPLRRTLPLLEELRDHFSSAPEITDLFNNPKLSRLKDILGQKTTTIPAKTSPVLGPGGQQIITQPARTVQSGGVLTAQEMKELRTHIGYMLEGKGGQRNIPLGDARRTYAALTRDMEDAARAQSPAALKALMTATNNYGIRSRGLKRLDSLINEQAAEKVFHDLNDAAKVGKSGDSDLLQEARRVMKPDEWNDVGATIIRRLGEPSASTTRIEGQPAFSINSYATNWNKLDGRAKDLLFGHDTPASPRAGLEQLARVVNAQKGVADLANTSRSGEYGKLATLVSTFFGSLYTGHPQVAAAVAGSAATDYAIAKTLMSPNFTRLLYRAPNMLRNPGGEDAVMQSLSSLYRQQAGTEAGRERADRDRRQRRAPPPQAPSYPWQPQP